MGRLSWYWHRLRAMSFAEMALHARKKFRQAVDARQLPDWSGVDLTCSGAYPRLPRPEDAPQVLREALQRDVENILAGRWKFFGHLELQVDDPPKWQCDYLVRRDLATNESAFKLNYRSLPEGVDSKLIWEPSRWYQLVRLAMAAYVLGDRRAGEKCVEWLEDWVKHNPPYRGWNWTSALEVGMRLIQFAWIDALLVGAINDSKSALRGVGSPSPQPSPPGRGSSPTAALEDNGRLASSNAVDVSPSPGAAGEAAAKKESSPGRGEGGRSSEVSFEERLKRLRRAILPPHAWYAWRHKSFGSSANNHLLGELAGCIATTVRWPGLVKCGATLEELQRHWENEVLAQFAEDGGNKEQALNYQLFSWEFCWQARMALVATGRAVSPEVDGRIRRAAQFFVDMQVPSDPWDYGDSDNACVVPLFADEAEVVAEWYEWFRKPERSGTMDYWMREARQDLRLEISEFKAGDWQYAEGSGYAICRDGDWILRWDLSPLGLGSMAAHGHLDSLHLSLWLCGVAIVVDPGTGAYHADKQLRDWLASRTAHNAPNPEGEVWPRRLGPFLWANIHEMALADGGLGWGTSAVHKAELVTGSSSLGRIIERPEGKPSLTAQDWVESLRDDWRDAASAFSVRWQFAPESRIDILGERHIRVTRRGVSVEVQVSADWAEVWCVTKQSQVAKADPDAPMAGTVSPGFRKTVWAPYLKLVARPQGDKPCVFTTTFLASAHS